MTKAAATQMTITDAEVNPSVNCTARAARVCRRSISESLMSATASTGCPGAGIRGNAIWASIVASRGDADNPTNPNANAPAATAEADTDPYCTTPTDTAVTKAVAMTAL